MFVAMDTPPPPSFSLDKKQPLHDKTARKPLLADLLRADFSAKKPLITDKTAKTPFQAALSSAPLREFRSEYQPRVSSRFAQERANKSNYDPASDLLARIGTVVKNKQVSTTKPAASSFASASSSSAGAGTYCSKLPVAKQQPPPQQQQQQQRKDPSVISQNSSNYAHTPHNLQQRQQQYQQQQPAPNPIPKLPNFVQLQPQYRQQQQLDKPQQPQLQQQQQQQQQTIQPLQPHQPQQPLLQLPLIPLQLPVSQPAQASKHHLIQDTRIRPNNKIGPIATATKAPLSVSQYTQPTPSSNKSAHQVSRAQSESSIKYQVKVNDKTYKILRKIGAGGSAKVYEGFEPNTYESFAIKIINVAKADPKTRESYFNEQEILSGLKDSKYVVRMYNSEYKTECKELVIVMEKGDADLSQVLDYHYQSKAQTGIIDGIFIKFYWRGMLLAVNEIHEHGIVHADLKPVNFILVKNQIKLIDFGIASTIDPESTSVIKDYQIGTINYMAPESLRNRTLEASFVANNNQRSPYDELDIFHDENDKRPHPKKTVIKYNSKADIWSLGCILYNFVYGRPPFDKYPDIASKVQAITNPRHVIDFPEINNAQLLHCMKLCLHYNPDDRPTAAELLNHSYLKDDVVIVRPPT